MTRLTRMSLLVLMQNDQGQGLGVFSVSSWWVDCKSENLTTR